MMLYVLKVNQEMYKAGHNYYYDFFYDEVDLFTDVDYQC